MVDHSEPKPTAMDIVIHVDREILKWLDMKDFPNDPQELSGAILEAVYLAYARV